jgi:hypothetical protein
MFRRLQINLVLYCFLWHLIWLFSCSLYYINDGNACGVKSVSFTQSIAYRPIVALQSAKTKQARVCISPSSPSTESFSITAFFRVTEPNQRAAALRCSEPCVATAYNPPQLLPSRASPA